MDKIDYRRRICYKYPESSLVGEKERIKNLKISEARGQIRALEADYKMSLDKDKPSFQENLCSEETMRLNGELARAIVNEAKATRD